MKRSRALAGMSVRHLGSDPLLLTTTLMLASNSRVDIVIQVVTILIAVTLVLCGRNPKSRLSVKGLILAREVNTITTAGSIATALGQGAGALGQL
jgi:hypothetical protein